MIAEKCHKKCNCKVQKCCLQTLSAPWGQSRLRSAESVYKPGSTRQSRRQSRLDRELTAAAQLYNTVNDSQQKHPWLITEKCFGSHCVTTGLTWFMCVNTRDIGVLCNICVPATLVLATLIKHKTCYWRDVCTVNWIYF